MRKVDLAAMSRLHDYSGIVTERFVETGSNIGYTLELAAKHFPECLSIELDKGYYEFCIGKFKCHKNVKLFYGHSPHILRLILDPQVYTTFWLDAHYCGDGNKGAYEECPLLKELETITEIVWTKPPIILIDDAEMFINRPGAEFDQSAWPTVEQIDAALPKYARTRRDGAFLYRVES